MKDELFIHCKRVDGSTWIVTCADMPGLILTHASLDACLHDFVPAANKLKELSEKLRAKHQRSAG